MGWKKKKTNNNNKKQNKQQKAVGVFESFCKLTEVSPVILFKIKSRNPCKITHKRSGGF